MLGSKITSLPILKFVIIKLQYFSFQDTSA
jgi:hypothetical protein